LGGITKEIFFSMIAVAPFNQSIAAIVGNCPC